MDDKKIRVMIVDDSPLVREALNAILSADPGIEVAGMAKDGAEAVAKAAILKPDVITMDLTMPVMSGLEAIEKIMQENPIPIIAVSGRDPWVIVKALDIGALDFVPVTQDIEWIAQELTEKIKIASRIKPLKRMRLAAVRKAALPARGPAERVFTIGASTGGPQALQFLLSHLPHDFAAGVLIVQHMAAGFMPGLVEWLKITSSLELRVAVSGDTLKSGMVYFAPDGYHTIIERDSRIYLREDTAAHRLHVPSIDEMMKSASLSYGRRAIGVLMTGMGSDGVEGMKAIQGAGGVTIAQDEKSSAIYGMNKLAVERGYVDQVAPLDELAKTMLAQLGR